MIAGLLAAFSGRALWASVAALAAIGLLTGVFMYGRAVGVQAGRVEAMAATVEAYQKRDDVDATVRNMDAADLCVELGGVPVECNELRGLE